ncbi:unnamed protein product [Gadus morhua 'NCC']
MLTLICVKDNVGDARLTGGQFEAPPAGYTRSRADQGQRQRGRGQRGRGHRGQETLFHVTPKSPVHSVMQDADHHTGTEEHSGHCAARP